MKWVSYDEMKKLPVGTVYYRHDPDMCQCWDELEGPYRKDFESENDIFYFDVSPIVHLRHYDPDRPYDHVELGQDGTREGLFDGKARYLIMEPEDIALMVAGLTGQACKESHYLPMQKEQP